MVFISAATGEGIKELLLKIEETVAHKWQVHTVRLPADKVKLLPFIYARTLVCSRKDTARGINLKIMATHGNYKAVLSKLEE